MVVKNSPYVPVFVVSYKENVMGSIAGDELY